MGINIDIKEINNVTVKVADTLRNVFKPDNFNVKALRMAIQAVGVGNETNLWIRIGFNSNGMFVDFNNLYIDERLQRKGVMQKAMDSVYKMPEIRSIIVSSVITEAMVEYCIKNKIKEYTEMKGYIKAKR